MKNKFGVILLLVMLAVSALFLSAALSGMRSYYVIRDGMSVTELPVSDWDCRIVSKKTKAERPIVSCISRKQGLGNFIESVDRMTIEWKAE